MKKLTTILALTVLTAGTLSAAGRTGNSFAIVVDAASYAKCTASIDDYCRSVRSDGLDAFISARDWKTPEQVKDSLLKWYDERSLEGAVFVGDIPIPMIRRAQFLTSAFKMDENGFEWRDCSVPSDRFYDDFDLKFELVRHVKEDGNFFFYNLSEAGEQQICCDIYTARIKPSSAWGDKYVELDNYFRKLVKVRAEQGNKLDHVASFTGEGSFSDSMIAWKDEQRTLAEQAPDAFKHVDGARFSTFHQDPIMKDMLLEQARLDEMDLFLFHCHGTPDRQWIGGFIDQSQFTDDSEPETWDEMYTSMYRSMYELVRYQARSRFRRYLRFTDGDAAAAAKRMYDAYGLDETFYADATDPEVARQDSLIELRTGIVLSDVHAADPNARIVLFDACYNGDFREDDCIALRYIMGRGNTVVGLGNSVNVLQDKASSPLLGMLTAGYSVGQWQQQVNILESHIIGDPTFHFTPSYDIDLPDLGNMSVKYWKKYAGAKYPADIRGLALQKLVNLGYVDAPKLLRDTYFSSDSYCLRYQCMTLLLEFDADDLSREVLVAALDDPYEFTRRKASYFLSLRGDASTMNELVKTYMRDYNAKRLEFNILGNCSFFGARNFMDALEAEIAAQGFVYDTAAFKANARRYVRSSDIKEYIEDVIVDKSLNPKRRASRIGFLRNNPYPFLAGKVIAIVTDESEDSSLRVTAAEALGWYTYAWNRQDIVDTLEKALPGIKDRAVSREVKKTVKRLEAYLK